MPEAGMSQGMYSGNEHARSNPAAVRAARERLHAQRMQQQGQSSSNPRVAGLQPRSKQTVSPTPRDFSPGGPQSIPTPPSSRGNASPAPAWPLPDVPSSPPQTRSQRGPPPQRPPRPSYVPSILDPSRSDNVTSQPPLPPPEVTLEPPQGQWEDDSLPSSYSSSNLSRPLTVSSQASAASSHVSLSDFPVPSVAASAAAAAQPPRKSLTLGPPPVLRRGPSSYYSQISYVSPIAEESEASRSHNSYASSNVIPGGIQNFYFDDADATPSDGEVSPLGSPFSDGNQSRESEHDDQSGLVRQASLGRRTKPSLTTIKSTDSVPGIDKRRAQKAVGIQSGSLEVPKQHPARSSSAPRDNALKNGTGLLDPSSSSSESLEEKEKSNMNGLQRAGSSSQAARTRSPLAPIDSKVAYTPDDAGKNGSLESPVTGAFHQAPRQHTLANRIGTRRPPKLNVDAVREAEARGSLTSLSDLIRRATRLASNLDRGRTASRIDMDLWEDVPSDKHKDFGERDSRYRSGSITDMLASFPPPAFGTPRDGTPNGSRPISRWPSAGISDLRPYIDTPNDNRGQRRRCCGMPLWGFLILLTILVCLIVAAVVVPVVLIVLPQQNQSSGSVAERELAQCEKTAGCQNGGVAIVNSSGSCGCLCVNGYTGETCTTQKSSSCTTIDVDGTKAATVGSSLPRLLSGAQSNYSIPLNASTILALFSKTNLSCASENALVTFNSIASRSDGPVDLPVFDEGLDAALLGSTEVFSPAITATPTLAARKVVTELPVTSYSVATTNGILYAVSPSATAASSTASSTSASSTSSFSKTSSETLDFARIGVLYIMQVSRSLDAATAAQEKLQTFFEDRSSTVADAKNVTLGSGYDIDLVDLTLTLKNGTQVGSGATMATATATASSRKERRAALSWFR